MTLTCRGAVYTDVTGENDAGDFVGFYITEPFSVIGFVNLGGVPTSFTMIGNDTFPKAINNLGQIVGYYGFHHGFFRDADGTLTFPIDYPNSTFTEIYGLNDRGLMVGTWESADFDLHGLRPQPDKPFCLLRLSR
jgi:hypothetical protein